MKNSEPAPMPTCILILQGGGAMGAYHIGAYQALREHGFDPDWICGISMGAINGAILAGNPPERRLQRLDAFWQAISWPLPSLPWPAWPTWYAGPNLEHTLSNAQALAFGQPGFFEPRPLSPYLAPPGPAATSFYDTAPLFGTLCALVDFDLLNRGPTRLSVGATEIETGSLVFFDSHRMATPFGPEHVVASGSLPPGFPPTPIGGKLYWDGGCVSNTPLEAVLDDTPAGHAVVFVVDLWNAEGPPPETMNAVEWRAKQIRYASRTAHHVDSVATKINLRHAMRQLGTPNATRSRQRLDLVHIIYHPGADQIPASDAEFSRPSIAERRAAGLADMRRALCARPWQRPERPAYLGCVVHRVTPAGVTTLPEPNLDRASDRAAAVRQGD